MSSVQAVDEREKKAAGEAIPLIHQVAVSRLYIITRLRRRRRRRRRRRDEKKAAFLRRKRRERGRAMRYSGHGVARRVEEREEKRAKAGG